MMEVVMRGFDGGVFQEEERERVKVLSQEKF